MPADRRVLGPLDTDTAPEAVENGRSAALRNVQLERGYVTTVRGNVQVGALAGLPSGAALTVGACLNPDVDGVVWLVWSGTGAHTLVHWQPGMASPAVLLTWAGLNLPARRGLTHAAMFDGELLYVDADGALRLVNLARAAAGLFTAPLLAADPYALHLVHQPPAVAPAPTLENNTDTTDPRTRVNLVGLSAWQFALQYEYPGGERTPLGPYSTVLPDSGSNFIRVPYPAGQLAASPLVRAIRLLVRRDAETTWLVAGELTPGTAFDFYGVTTGEALTGADAAKLFEAVPVRVGCVGVAGSRVFVGDCTEGQPATRTLADLLTGTAPVETGSTVGDVTITVYRVRDDYRNADNDIDSEIHFYHLLAGTYPDPASSYFEVVETAGKYYPVTGNTVYSYADAFTGIRMLPGPFVGTTVTVLSATLAGAADPPPTDNPATWHERSTYPVGIAYFDALGRTAGAEAVREVVIPRQDYGAPLPQAITWALPPGALPPAWATSYHLVVGPSRTAAHFLQFKTDPLLLYYGDDASGVARTARQSSPLAGETPKALWVSAARLATTGRGYAFVEGSGDQLRFAAKTAPYTTFPVLYQRGDYLAINPNARDLFAPGGEADPLVELYQVAAPVESRLFYERGPRYAILNAGQAGRAHSVLAGRLAGDALLVSPDPAGPGRDLYTEAMFTTGRNYDAWLDVQRGRAIPAVKDSQQVRRLNLVRWSSQKISGTLLYGLSQWDALSQQTVPLEAGAVVALAVASPAQGEGRSLVAVQERGAETLYLGQVPLSVAARQQQTQLIVSTDAVVGGTNPLTGGLGTRHPGSLVRVDGRLYWWCADQGQVCRYAADGVNPLNTLHQCQALGRELAAAYAGADIVAGYDPRTKEYVLCFGATEQASARTVRFSERLDGFGGDVDYAPEAVVGSSNVLYSVQAGQLWRHTDAAPRLTWYGVAFPARASVWANAAASLAKTWLSLVLEGGGPLWELVDATTLDGQQTRTPAARMELEEGKWVGALLMDANSPGFTGTDARRRALYEGVPVQSETLLCTLECADTTPAARLVAVGLDFIINGGQTAP